MTKTLMNKLYNNEFVLVADGYIQEAERRGYLQAGAFVPEIVIEHPEVVEDMHREFIHAGSDVVMANTHFITREKLRLIGREHDLERMNRAALRIAKKVAKETNTMMAATITTTTAYDPQNPSTHDKVYHMFKEEVEWAASEGADYIIAQSFTDFGEAKMALDAIKQYGLPAVVTFVSTLNKKTRDGLTMPEACKKIEECGADVVGLNMTAGPWTIVEEISEIRNWCKVPIACLPNTYRCTQEKPIMQTLIVPETNQRAFPDNLDCFLVGLDEISKFAHRMRELNVKYVGLSWGNSPRYFRRLAEALDRRPQASRYSPDMSKHAYLGDCKYSQVHQFNVETLKQMFTGH